MSDSDGLIPGKRLYGSRSFRLPAMVSRSLLIGTAPLLAIAGCFSASTDIDVALAQTRIAQGWQVLDVRSAGEWQGGHLQGATRIDINGPDFAGTARRTLDPSRPVLIYCRSGVRSAKAATVLGKQGFSEIETLQGGIIAWQDAGAAVVRP